MTHIKNAPIRYIYYVTISFIISGWAEDAEKSTPPIEEVSGVSVTGR